MNSADTVAVIDTCIHYGVLVRIRGLDSLKQACVGRTFSYNGSGYTSYSGSGILFDALHGLVITSATLVHPFLQKNGGVLKRGTKIDVLVGGNSDHESARAHWKSAHLAKIVKSGCFTSLIHRFSPRGEWLVGWPSASKQLYQNGHNNTQMSIQDAVLSKLYWDGLAEVAVLRITGGLPAVMHRPIRFAPSRSVNRGDSLLIVGSPYGILSPSIFYNCVYLVTASNLIVESLFANRFSSHNEGLDDAVIMLDRPGLPGCEGGPVFDIEARLVGMSIPPIHRSDESRITISFTLPITASLIKDVLQVLNQIERSSFGLERRQAETIMSSPHVPSLRKAFDSIVLISIGTTWGSGIFICEDGVILTVAHLIRPFLASPTPDNKFALQSGYSIRVRVDSVRTGYSKLNNGSKDLADATPLNQSSDDPQRAILPIWHHAAIEYISQSCLDVAVLRLEELVCVHCVLVRRDDRANLTDSQKLNEESRKSLDSADFSVSGELKKGEKIYILSHSLFGPDKGLQVTCNSGVISGITYVRGKPCLLQTSTTIYRGASGGAVLDASGRLIGLVVCNVVNGDKSIVSSISFSIPVNLLLSVWDQYLHNGDTLCFQTLDTPDKELEAIWSPRFENKSQSSHATKFLDYASRYLSEGECQLADACQKKELAKL
ncbi:uncharacterized protein LOC126323751 [Schistocerca gregaria]|uniref:uncharacterized protein LOC126323751 n=1 Tax=Schistocerca gregaria TaxID=7010 RepID=UPI00211E1067|nr:uncharacterized protein LOC126323751 [Schistocerca gregaria]